LPERPTYYWDAAVARFRSGSGRFVSAATVRRLSRKMEQAGFVEVASLASRVHGGSISVPTWDAAMREQIKREYLRQYMLGRGGRSAMSFADWGRCGQMLRTQYRTYLSRFGADIAAGKLSEAQIAARAQMYVESAKQAYERGRLEANRVAGYDLCHWQPEYGVENCPDCLAFDAMGWIPVEGAYDGCVPASGCTQCHTRCYCTIEYRRSTEQ